MKNIVNRAIFWLLSLFIGWISGYVILWNLIAIIIPQPNATWEDDLWAIGALEYFLYMRVALVGMLILIIASLSGSFLMNKSAFSWNPNCGGKKYRWPDQIVVGLQIALAGYMIACGVNLKSFWHYLLFPLDVSGGQMRGIELFDLLTPWTVIIATTYIVVFEHWIIFLQNHLKANAPISNAKLLTTCRAVIYIILSLLLLGWASPVSVISSSSVIAIALAGIFLLVSNIRQHQSSSIADQPPFYRAFGIMHIKSIILGRILVALGVLGMLLGMILPWFQTAIPLYGFTSKAGYQMNGAYLGLAVIAPLTVVVFKKGKPREPYSIFCTLWAIYLLFFLIEEFGSISTSVFIHRSLEAELSIGLPVSIVGTIFIIVGGVSADNRNAP
jgi:hypothetical protein